MYMYLCFYCTEKVISEIALRNHCDHRFALGTQIGLTFIIIIRTNDGEFQFIGTVVRVDYGASAIWTFADGYFPFTVVQWFLLISNPSNKQSFTQHTQEVVRYIVLRINQQAI